MTSLNSNFSGYEASKSDLLQKYLAQQNSYASFNSSQNTQAAVQNPYQKPAAPVPVLENQPDNDEFKKKETGKKARIAAVSLAGVMTIAAATLLGKTNAGRKLLKKTGSLASKGYEKTLQKLRDVVGGEKIDNAIRSFYDFRDNKLTKLNAVPENLVNGKDVFSRNAADFVTGRKIDMSKLSGTKKKAAEIYKATVGRVLSWFHLLDKHSTKLYESESIKGGVQKYVKASSKYKEYSEATAQELKKVLSANPDKTFKVAGKEHTGSKLLKTVEQLFDDTGNKVADIASEASAKGRISNYNNMLKGLNKDGEKTAQSLTEKAADGFMDKIKGKKFKDLLTEPVAGNILQQNKANYTKDVKSVVDSITRTTGTVIEETAGDVASIKKILGTGDIDTYSEIDKTLRIFDKYKKGVFNGSASSSKAQKEICGKLDDLISRIAKSNNPNGAEAIKTLENVKKSITNIKGGTAEDIMGIAQEVLDSNTYNNVIMPKYQNFQKSLQGAYHNETTDVLDKLRDINCGSAPTDFMTVIGSTALFGLYTAQAENNDERVSLTLSTGLPLLSTVTTNLLCAIKSISGGKSMAVSLAAGAATKFVCDKLNKAFRKSKGLDENSKPSIVTIDDYIPYKNKFGEIFLVPAGADMSMIDEKDVQKIPPKEAARLKI